MVSIYIPTSKQDCSPLRQKTFCHFSTKIQRRVSGKLPDNRRLSPNGDACWYATFRSLTVPLSPYNALKRHISVTKKHESNKSLSCFLSYNRASHFRTVLRTETGPFFAMSFIRFIGLCYAAKAFLLIRSITWRIPSQRAISVKISTTLPLSVKGVS